MIFDYSCRGVLVKLIRRFKKTTDADTDYSDGIALGDEASSQTMSVPKLNHVTRPTRTPPSLIALQHSDKQW